MGRLRDLFCMEMKRVKKMLPSALFFALLLFGSIVAMGKLIYTLNSDGEEKSPVKVVLVGDISDPFLQFGFNLVTKIDVALMEMQIEFHTEEEARRMLQREEASLYVRVPDGFVAAVNSGENMKAQIVSGSGQKNLNSFMVREAADAGSEYITSSQSAIFALQYFLTEKGLTEHFWEYTNALNVRYFKYVFDRHSMARTEELGYGEHLSLTAYYFCGLCILALLLLGMVCSPFLIGRERDFHRLLASRGLGAGKQVAAEYLAFLIAVCGCFVLIFAIAGGFVYSGRFEIPEWSKARMETILGFGAAFFPVVCMIAALQYLLYELVPGTVTQLILQFVGAIGMGYVSGCFYPSSFFPEGLQLFGEILPSGTALLYAQQCLTGQSHVAAGAVLMLETALFLGTAVLLRRRKLSRG